MSSNTIAIINLLVELNTDPLSVRKLQEKTGLGEAAVYKYVNLLHKKKLIRIAEWHRHHGCDKPVAYYEWNQAGKLDLRPPKRVTSVERSRKYRAKLKAKKLGLPVDTFIMMDQLICSDNSGEEVI